MNACVRLRKKLAGTTEETGSSESDLDEDSTIRNRLSLIKHESLQKNIHIFIAKVLLAKCIQHLISLACIAFVFNNPKIFSDVHEWVLIIPATVWVCIFISVHFLKEVPRFSICAFLLLLSSLSIGYMIGDIFRHIRYYFVFLPATLMCLLVTNILFIPVCYFSFLRPSPKSVLFHVIPQMINVCLNILVIIMWTSMVKSGMLNISQSKLDMRSESDAVLLVAVPTFFWSFAFNLLMSTRIKDVVEGRMFQISRYRMHWIFAPVYFLEPSSIVAAEHAGRHALDSLPWSSKKTNGQYIIDIIPYSTAFSVAST